MNEILVTRNELYELVWAEPMLQLSKKYSISDNGLRKICISMNIPLPKAGHWMKIQSGKKVSKQQLPEKNSGKTEVKLKLREEGEEYNNSEYSEFKHACNEINSLIEANGLKPSDKLATNNSLIIEAKKSLAEKNRSYKFEGLITTSNNNLNIEVSAGKVNRALCFMDFLIKVVKLRGHEIIVNNHETFIKIKGEYEERDETIKIIFRERCKRVMVKDGHWAHTQLHANGILYFKAEGYHGGEWVEGKRKLEEQVPNMIAKWELSVKQLHKYHKDARMLREKEQAIERKAKQLVESKEKEFTRFKSLLNESNRWQEVKILRSYLDVLEQKAIETNSKTHEFDEWLVWAKTKADWYDPLTQSRDELLDDIKIETH